MKKKYIYIAESGYTFLVNGGENSLKDLQTLVDGLVDVVEADKTIIGFPCDTWVNDEGLYRNDFGINLFASVITGRQIVGPAVLARSINGATTGILDSQIRRLVKNGLIIDDNDGNGWYPEEAARFALSEGVEV